MRDKKIVVPKGMLDAAMWQGNLVKGGFDPYIVMLILKAVLRWMSDHPIVPTVQDAAEMAEAEKCGNIGRIRPFSVEDCITFYATEWQRRMFFTPEPEGIDDLLLPEGVHPWKSTNKAIAEAYRRGREERNR